MDWFFFENSFSKKVLIKIVNVIKKEVGMESLRKISNFICEFCKVKQIIVNCNLRTIEKTNITYPEPHKIIINKITFLF